MHYFEHSLRKDAEIFDPNPPTSETSDEERKDIVAVIPFFPSDTVGNVGMAQIYASSGLKNTSTINLWVTYPFLPYGSTRKIADFVHHRKLVMHFPQMPYVLRNTDSGEVIRTTKRRVSERNRYVVFSSVSRPGGYYGARKILNLRDSTKRQKMGFCSSLLVRRKVDLECLGEEFFKNLENNCMYSWVEVPEVGLSIGSRTKSGFGSTEN